MHGAVVVRAQDEQVCSELAGLIENRSERWPLDGQSALHTHALGAQGRRSGLRLLMLGTQCLCLCFPYDVVLRLFTGIATFDVADKIRIGRCNVNDFDDCIESSRVSLRFCKEPVGSSLQVDSNNNPKVFVHDRLLHQKRPRKGRFARRKVAEPPAGKETRLLAPEIAIVL
jgi:hypothetical protein